MSDQNKISHPPPESSRRIALFIGAIFLWLFTISLILNHQLALGGLPDTPPAIVPDGVVYQSTDYSCGPASLATIFRHYNVIKSEREWAELAGTNISRGTKLHGLISAGKSMGFEPVELNPSFEQLDLIAWPSIVFQSNNYHLVTFWGMDTEGSAIIRDPVYGCTRWTPYEFNLNTPNQPALLVFYPGPVPRCEPDTQPIEIARFQNMLSKIGYYKGQINGDWSADLEGAITSFQRDMNLDPIGTADPPTSIYLEGAWRLVTRGSISPFMSIDRANDRPIDRRIPILTRLTPSEPLSE